MIRSSDLYSYLITEPLLTSICDVYNNKPPFDFVDKNNNYLFIEKSSDNKEIVSMDKQETRLSRFSLFVVAKNNLGVGEDQESLIYNIFDALDSVLIVPCNSTLQIGNFVSTAITDDSVSPLLYTDNQEQYASKDYLIEYHTND